MPNDIRIPSPGFTGARQDVQAAEWRSQIEQQYPGASVREYYPGYSDTDPSFGGGPHITLRMPDPTPAPAQTGGTQTGGTAAPDMNAFLQTLMQQQGPTATQQTTETTAAARSPQLEAQIQNALNQQNQLTQGFTQAFAGKEQAFEDVIRALQNAYQNRAGTASGATSTAALNSGLTPLEASQLGQGALEDTLQRMYPELARLRGDQAEVPIALQQALQSLSQQNQGFIGNVIAPYQKGVAGQTSTRSGETTDTLGRDSLISQILMQQQQRQDVQAQSQQQAEGQQQRTLFDQMMQMANLQEGGRQADLDALVKQQGQQTTLRIAQLREAGLDDRQAADIAANLGISELEQMGMDNRLATQIMASLKETSMQQAGAGQRAQIGAGAQIGSAQIGAQSRGQVAQLGSQTQLLTTQMQQSGATTRSQENIKAQLLQALLPYTQGMTPAQQAQIQTQLGVAGMQQAGATSRAQLPYQAPTMDALVKAQGSQDPNYAQSRAGLDQFYKLQKDGVIGVQPLDPDSGKGLQYRTFQETPWGTFPILKSEVWGIGSERGDDAAVVYPWLGKQGGGSPGTTTPPSPGGASVDAPANLSSEDVDFLSTRFKL